MTTTATLISDMQAEIDELRAENESMENLLAMDVHSCGPNCTKSPCVNRRLREENEALRRNLEAQLAARDQQVAEACAETCRYIWDNRQRFCEAIDCEQAIRSGEWKKHMEVK